MPEQATYSVAIAWEAVPDSAFVLNASQLDSQKQLTSTYTGTVGLIEFGYSTFGGTDVFGGDFAGLFDNVTTYVKSFQVTRGRTQNLDAYSAGECTIVLNDPTGRFNPLNTSSPVYPYVVPGRAVRIEANYNGTVYPIYYGFVRSIEHNPSKQMRETRVICQDIFMFLSRAKLTITNSSVPTTTGACIGRVLDAINWTYTNLRSLDTGDTINTTWPGSDNTGNGTTDGLSLVQKLLLTERGTFYQSRSGVVTYKDRFSRYKSTSQATLTNVSTEAAPAIDLTTVVNTATVTKTGAGSQTYTDSVSVSNYGQTNAATIDSPYLNDATQCLSLATWLVKQQSTPVSPMRSLSYYANTSAALMTNALARELGDRITVSDTATGVSNKQFFVEGISHEVTEGGTKHLVKFALAQVPAAAPIIFGTSRMVNGSFSSPTTTVNPYTTTGTTADVFAY